MTTLIRDLEGDHRPLLVGFSEPRSFLCRSCDIWMSQLGNYKFQGQKRR
jgi:hypothetical protein